MNQLIFTIFTMLAIGESNLFTFSGPLSVVLDLVWKLPLSPAPFSIYIQICQVYHNDSLIHLQNKQSMHIEKNIHIFKFTLFLVLGIY